MEMDFDRKVSVTPERDAPRPPDVLSQMTRVGIAIVRREGAILVGIRDARAVLGGKHEFPGGKCFDGENAADCAERECYEETGLTITADSLLQRVEHIYDYGQLQLSFYLCHLSESSPSIPATPFKWVPINQLQTLNFPAANQSAIELLQQQFIEER